ncbi:hypothetical protein [Paraburkholderia sp. SIMBA_054]|uniref:hypothetical protein n=1 Tax=Paraburkholderia sp. SIMBA_054 TaxID=3085795 RepID=UPI00397CF5BE
MAMTREEFEQKIGTVLRAHGAGVTADLTDELLAYWNGHAVAYVLICAEPPDACYEEFSMDDAQWANWRSWLEAWIEAPTFSVRPEVHNWLSEEPPAEPGE